MVKKIRLTIEEIVKDFEELIRHDERLDTLFDMEKACDDDIEKFHEEMIALMEKYLPNYRQKVSDEYFSDETTSYEKALILYNDLYENFKEIFYQLI